MPPFQVMLERLPRRRRRRQLIIRYPSVYPHHEAEDLDKIPPTIFLAGQQLAKLKDANLHKALYLTEYVGSMLPAELLQLDNPLMTLGGRKHSFPLHWNGPPAQEMAKAGFYYDEEENKPICYICNLAYRNMNTPDQCPWKTHKSVAPNCLHLKRMMEDTSRSIQGRRLRRCSLSSLDCLLNAQMDVKMDAQMQ